MYESVLVPTDGSAGVERALHHALGIADRCDASLHTVHVVQKPDLADELAEDSILDRLAHAGEEAVETIVEDAHAAGHEDVHSAVREGVPAAEILDYTDENGIDVIVMATAGRTGTAREMVGSVTETVVRAASVPVLTVNVGES